jgi:antitoxin component YwqK of YwqJK toxin-antitoxin module
MIIFAALMLFTALCRNVAWCIEPPSIPLHPDAQVIKKHLDDGRIRERTVLRSGAVIRERYFRTETNGKSIADGPDRRWYASGQKDTDWSWKAGAPVGVWLHWNEDGSLAWKEIHESGQAVRRWEWYPSGAKLSEWVRLNDGRWSWTVYNENGTVKSRDVEHADVNAPNTASQPPPNDGAAER